MDIIRFLIILLWTLALAGFAWSIFIHPRSQARERIFYYSIICSYVLHVIVMFTVFALPIQIKNTTKNVWSMGVYIHGGAAILIKEITAILRVRLFKEKNNDRKRDLG